MSSPRPSLDISGHWCRPDSFRGPRNVGRYWLRRCRARCWYVPSRLTIEATSKHLEPIGSIAATLQAGIGNVAAGSIFAGAQSMAMGGGVPAAVSAVGGLATAAIAAVVI
jgi:hypothetical protein